MEPQNGPRKTIVLLNGSSLQVPRKAIRGLNGSHYSRKDDSDLFWAQPVHGNYHTKVPFRGTSTCSRPFFQAADHIDPSGRRTWGYTESKWRQACIGIVGASPHVMTTIFIWPYLRLHVGVEEGIP